MQCFMAPITMVVHLSVDHNAQYNSQQQDQQCIEKAPSQEAPERDGVSSQRGRRNRWGVGQRDMSIQPQNALQTSWNLVTDKDCSKS